MDVDKSLVSNTYNYTAMDFICGLTSQRCRTTSKSLDLVDHFDSLALNAFLGLSACVVDIHFQGLSHGHFFTTFKGLSCGTVFVDLNFDLVPL